MDKKERMAGVDDYIALLSGIMGRMSLALGTKLTEEDRKKFVDFHLEARKLLIEKYDRQIRGG